jgi:hypothetical protein
MRTSESISNVAKALCEAQKNISHAAKDKTNPHFKNDYATLESVIDATKQALLDQGISVLQGVSKSDVTTRLLHTSGEWIESSVELILDRQNMQGLGSAITYARRYSLASMLNISQADDDANEASKPPVKQQSQPTPKPQPQQQKPPAQSKAPSDISEWIIELGPQSKLSGTRLKDHDINFLIEQRDNLLAWYTKMGKNPHENVLKFVDALAKYIEQMT